MVIVGNPDSKVRVLSSYISIINPQNPIRKYNMILTRREFIKICGGLIASAGIKLDAFSSERDPYVEIGDIVNYIGSVKDSGFTGGQLVKYVDEWDEIGYPVTLYRNTYCNPPEEEIYYDIDLSDFKIDVPERFWCNPENKKYPNVHTYVRMKRYGESLHEAVVKMNISHSSEVIRKSMNFSLDK